MATDLIPPEPPRRPPPPFAERFRVGYAILGLLLAGAIAATVLLLVFGERPAAFSSFVPTATDPVERSQQIADHVAARYVDESGAPVVSVQAGEDDKAVLPGSPQVVAVGTNPPGIVSNEYGDILFFRMCSSGPDCAIPKDSPPGLASVLAREARELALYGLRYVPEAAFVMVIVPPGFVESPDPSNPVRVVHFYRRADVEDALDRPVAETLPGPPPTPGTLTESQARAIEAREAKTRYSLSSGTDAANTVNVYTITPVG